MTSLVNLLFGILVGVAIVSAFWLLASFIDDLRHQTHDVRHQAEAAKLYLLSLAKGDEPKRTLEQHRRVPADTLNERRKEPLTRRCAWCQTVQRGEKWQPEQRESPPPVTDTICPTCFARMTGPQTAN